MSSMTTFVAWLSFTLWLVTWVSQIVVSCPQGTVSLGIVGHGIYCINGGKAL